MARKDDFRVYTNKNIPKKKKEEITYNIDILEAKTLAALFMCSPYFVDCFDEEEMYFYPTDLSGEESELAPLIDSDTFWDFVHDSEEVREREEIPLAPLIHIFYWDEEGEEEAISIFHSILPLEILKFFRTAVMISNAELWDKEGFDEALEDLIQKAIEVDYLDDVMRYVCDYLEDPETLATFLFD